MTDIHDRWNHSGIVWTAGKLNGLHISSASTRKPHLALNADRHECSVVIPSHPAEPRFLLGPGNAASVCERSTRCFHDQEKLLITFDHISYSSVQRNCLMRSPRDMSCQYIGIGRITRWLIGMTESRLLWAIEYGQIEYQNLHSKRFVATKAYHITCQRISVFCKECLQCFSHIQ